MNSVLPEIRSEYRCTALGIQQSDISLYLFAGGSDT